MAALQTFPLSLIFIMVTNELFEVWMWNMVQGIMCGILIVSDSYENDGGGDAQLWS